MKREEVLEEDLTGKTNISDVLKEQYYKFEIYNEKLDKIESFKLPSYFYKEIIQKCPNELLNNDFDNSEEFINQLNNNLEFLRLKIRNNQKEAMKYYLPDLLNNAHRKIEEGFFDDAVARLYRAIELIAQVSLNSHDLIDVEKFKNHKVFHINRKQFKTQTKFDPEIPKMIQNWNIKEYEDRDKTFKVPKDKSYKILEAFGEDLAKKYFADERLKNAVNKRNDSILAHGLNPMNKKDAEDLYNRVLYYSKFFWVDIEKYMKMAEFPKFK